MSHSRDLPKNPLIRDGVSQRQRQTQALSPDSIQIDERDRTDFTVLAYRLSEKVNYYTADDPSLNNSTLANTSLANSSVTGSSLANHRNGSTGNGHRSDQSQFGQPQFSQPQFSQPQLDGNWQAFFEGSTPVQLALISKTRTQTVKDNYNQKLAAFLADNSCKMLLAVLNFWKTDILAVIQQWHQGLEANAPFRSLIKGLVKTNLKEPLLQMRAFERACGEEDTQFYEKFGQQFGLTFDAATLNQLPLPREARTELDTLFQALFQVYRQIVHQAPQAFNASLGDRQDHPPHLSLYYAFLEALQPARDDLNRTTQRHLDFFYRQVLALPDRPAQPDHAHLLFELAKLQTEYKLTAATRFQAGKDATGVDLFYALDQDAVIHQAKIARLHGLFLTSNELQTGEKPQNLLGLHASPVANSFDGNGEEFPKEQAVKAWLPFGDNKRPHAQLGLAIASDALLLQEGIRVIEIKLSLDGVLAQFPQEKLHQAFAVYLSGEKEWIAASILPAGQTPNSGGAERTRWEGSDLYLVIELIADVDPVLPYDPEAAIPFNPEQPNLPLRLDRPMPVLRLQLQDQVKHDGRSAYHYFQNVKLKDITIQARVPEVRNLVVQNDIAIIDPTKPFQPFGLRPVVGSTLYIGSQEVFQKNLSSLKLEIAWEGLPTDTNFAKHYRGYYLNGESVDGKTNAPDYFSNFSATVARLTKRTWSTEGLKVSSYNLFSPSGQLIDRSNSPPLPGEKIDGLTDFNPQTSSGFLRFVLQQDFLHDEFPSKFALQTLATAKDFEGGKYVKGAVYELSDETLKRWNPGDTMSGSVAPITINEPYTPTIRSLTLSYTAQAGKADCQLFHLHPFGGFEKWQQLPDALAPRSLLPQFTHEGELLIGIQGLNPPTALPLLLQVAEETADTSLRRIDEFKPQWWYLKDNQWKSLDDRIASDATKGLIASGIVNLGIPEDISNANTTILDPALYWVKVSVPARSRTVCFVIGAHTQAARVTFVDAGNDPNHLATPLPAGTIAKLENPQPEIKTIEQPYASFAGQVKEQPNHFYTRVSEQLRHKGRAVTIFDYERLVLEKFPDVYKVRCINHGEFADSRDRLYELRPGFVTLAVIPDLSQRRSTNDLEPKVNANLLQTIEDYLTQLSSSWTTIKVVNPQYERIQVEFQVRFRSPYDANFGYYQRELERAIVGFLTPWTLDQGSDINFGGRVYRSAILNFIEQQYYVDYIVDFKMHHDGQRNVREAIAATARSVLTSVSLETSGKNHSITEFKSTTAIAANSKIEVGVLGYEPLDELELGE